MPNETLLQPIPTTQAMADVEAILKPDIDVRGIGWIYDPDRCPIGLLEAMYWQFGASPLYWGTNPESVTRAIYNSFYTEDCGILDHRGGECALTLFSRATETSYHYTWRRNSNGRKVGITLYIPLPTTAAIDYANTPGGTAYLREAYRFLLPDRIRIDDIIYEDSHDTNIGVHTYTIVERLVE